MTAFLRCWLCSAIAACLLAFSVADENLTHEKITFVNFSEEPVAVHWVNPEGVWQEIVKVDGYDTFTTVGYSGHLFAYKWKEANTHFRTHSTSGIAAEEGEPDMTHVVPQVHILGGMDQPETKKVVCGTTKGDIHINVKPFWAPLGALRFLHLSHEPRYFDGCALNRVIDNFLTQFGIGFNAEQRNFFRQQELEIFDDPQPEPPINFRPGTISFAGKGPNTRSAEVFIVMPGASRETLDFFGKDNSWETPFGYVEPDDLPVVGSWQSYGDMPPVSRNSAGVMEIVQNCFREI